MHLLIPEVLKHFPAYPAEWEKARMGWLRRTFKVPQRLERQTINHSF